jgi:uncharacterized protein YndB with AHSA1/START domain
MARQQFQLEYIIRSSPTILHNFLVSPNGLAQWFSDTCDVNEDEYSFGWEGFIEKATLLENHEGELVRYQWVESDPKEYFEFKIQKSEVSNDTVLLVTDFAEDYDVEDQKLLWDNQIKMLIQQIGG